ncbi:hypothetical protein KFK09_013014 [Dendrobium nobile]|uniref:Uncharacterized protein n=1 Tax=Dendrobium nobile TaxID=94219 RepID=A0A8T3BL05_DENNO|nr:hypothetical protein KFK09_013014 [Dendrobium nobile]
MQELGAKVKQLAQHNYSQLRINELFITKTAHGSSSKKMIEKNMLSGNASLIIGKTTMPKWPPRAMLGL